MSSLSVTTPDGVQHDYIAGLDAAMTYARNRARVYPHQPVTVDTGDLVVTVTWTGSTMIERLTRPLAPA